MNLRSYLKLLFLFALLLPLALRAGEVPKSNEQRVRDFVAACNERKLDAMLSMVTEDIQWLNVDGDKIAVETQGKEALRAFMTAYFKSTPSAKSELEWVKDAGARVCAQERARWRGKSGEKSQRSLSIYEFRDGLIARVYYFPAEK